MVIPSLVLLMFVLAFNTPLRSAPATPRVHDPRVELSLFASEPDIVTPIGMAIDSRDRIFVIESHTHTPPRNYPGPKSDRIKVFRDSNRADPNSSLQKPVIFAEGLKDAMNLAFSPEGTLYVVCAESVWALEDRDHDDISDSRRSILEFKPPRAYSHSALLGITFGPDGWLYVSRGNNGSATYSIHGADSPSLTGYGDGGNIIRCRPDGSNLEEFATGFWNPFEIIFDLFGWLLCVDNDPDARAQIVSCTPARRALKDSSLGADVGGIEKVSKLPTHSSEKTSRSPFLKRISLPWSASTPSSLLHSAPGPKTIQTN